MAAGGLKVFTKQLGCAASNSSSASIANHLTTTVVKALTVTGKSNNTGTIYVGSAATLRQGIPLAPGQSVDFGPVPLMGRVWGEVDTTNLKVTSTTGTANKIIITWYQVNNAG